MVWEDDSISCEQHGRCLLARLRALAADAAMRAALVAQLVNASVTQGHAGFILDFETHEPVTPADNAAFNVFATELAGALRAHGKTLQIAVSPGKPIYDMPGLNASGATALLDYGTYASDDKLFERKLHDAIKYTGSSRLTLGLKSRHSNFSATELSMRFDTARALKLRSIFVWTNQDTILPSWLPYLKAFLAGAREDE